MIAGQHRRREQDGKYAVEQRCDACSQPIHGEHYTDDGVCGGTDGPGFFLCSRERCGAAYEGKSVAERREIFTAGRARSRNLAARGVK